MSLSNEELLRVSLIDQRRRGLRDRSIECRQNKLKTYMRYLGDRSPLEATQEDVEAFLDARPIGARTRYAWLSHLHSFYEMLARGDITDVDPTAKILRPKLPRLLPHPAASADLERALAKASPKHRCWIVLAAFEGLRCQEIAGLRREDIVETEGLLRVVHGKGGHERLLPLHAGVLTALEALPMPRVGWIFTRPSGGRYKPEDLSHEFNQFLRSAGVPAHTTAHALRHWFGTNLYGQTHDLRLTQEMLGHANLATTAIYTAFDRRAAAAAIGELGFTGDEEEGDPDPDVAA
jgi:integrase/recombinase XerC